MLQDTLFTNALKCRWSDLRTGTLATENINNYLNSMTDELGEAVTRNYERWPTLGTYVWPNSAPYAQASTHAEVMTVMKDWLEARVLWMDENIPGVESHCEIYENFNVLGLEDRSNKIEIYPNPTDGELNIKSDIRIHRIDLLDTQGKILQRIPNPSVSERVLLKEEIKNGMYFLQFRTDEGLLLRRILVNR